MFVSNGSLVTKTPVDLRGSSYFAGMPPLAGGWPSAYSGIYERQLWVYVVVTKRARATARLPLPVYLRDDKNRPRVDEHPMSQLLKNPNPGMSSFDLWLWISSTFDIFGETFLFKRRIPGPIGLELYPFHPSSMTYDEDKGTWTFDNGRTRIAGISDDDLIHFKSFSPSSMIHGLSPLEPLRSTLENEWNARTATSSFWQRGARPGLFLTHPKNMSREAADRLKAQFDSVTASSGNTGSTILLEEGLEPKSMMLTAEEAQYIETRKLNREEVCAAYDIPPPVVHILDHATFSNITEQMRSMYRDTMAPHLKGFEATIDMSLRRAEWPNDDIYAEFLMDDVLRGDFETRQTALALAKHMTIAEKRKVDNLPFIEGTDRIFLNAADQPMPVPTTGDAPAAPAFATVGLPALIDAGVISRDDARTLLGIPGESPALPDVPDPAALPAAAARSVAGRLSFQTNLDDVDLRWLVKGLDEEAAGSVLHAFVIEKANDGDVSSLRERIRALVKE